MRERLNPSKGTRRGDHECVRGYVALAVTLAVAAGAATFGVARPVSAEEAAPTCQPLFMNAALERQFKDIAPGVPYQAGGDPVQKQGRPEGKPAIIHMIIDQMGFIRQAYWADTGAAEVFHSTNHVRFCGSGTMMENGHTYQVSTYIYGMSLHRNAAREDVQAEGLDDKGRAIRVVLGNEAWDESVPGVGSHAADGLAKQRGLQLQRTAFKITDTLTNIDAAQVKVHDPGAGKGAVTMELPLEGVSTQVVLDQNYRPAKVTQRVDHHLIVDEYSDYRDLSQYGVMFPRHIVETVDGHPRLDLKVTEGEIAVYEMFPTPAFEPLKKPDVSDNLEFGGIFR